MEIKIQTLTPLWTGDINRQCSKIKETGIIGSLRWWYEALVRGFGGYACDPTSADKRCPDKDGNICHACKLFGCTALKRKFSLRVTNGIQKKDLIFLSRIEHPIFYYRKRERGLDFWFKELYKPPKAFYGNINFDVFSNSPEFSCENISNIIKFLLKIISVGGGLAAKNQSGFGIIQLLNTSIEEIERGYEIIQSIIKEEGRKVDVNFPSISEYKGLDILFDDINFLDQRRFRWYPKIPPKNAEYYQVGFAIKFLLRNCIKNITPLAQIICKNYDEIEKKCKEIKEKVRSVNVKKKYTPSKIIARSIFGSDLGEKWASLIFISDAWKEEENYKMRVWSFIPDIINYDKVKIDENETISLDCKIEKDQLIKTIQKIISDALEKVTFSETLDKKGLMKKVLEDE